MTPEQLMQAMVEIGGLPLPTLPNLLDPFALHQATLEQACDVLRRYLDQERVLVGKALSP